MQKVHEEVKSIHTSLNSMRLKIEDEIIESYNHK